MDDALTSNRRRIETFDSTANLPGFDQSPRPRPRQDSGYAWVIAGIGFVLLSVGFGVLYTFGGFLKPMTEAFASSRKTTSALFSTTVCITFLLGPLTGYLTDTFGTRVMLVAGALAMGLGLATTSLVNQLWLAYLTYGVAVGLGVACLYVPTLTLISGWFDKWRESALGLAVAGIGCGTLIIVPASASLIDRYGWRSAYVIMGVASCAVILFCAALAVPPPIRTRRSRTDIRWALRAPIFRRLYLGSLFFQIAQFIPFPYLADFARHLGASSVAAAGLIGVVGAASFFGRFAFAAFGNRFGVIRLYQASVFVFAASYGLWLFATTYRELVAFALLMGASYGGFVALSPAVAAQIFGIEGLGSILGAFYTSAALGVAIGPPVAGWLIDLTNSFRPAIGFALAMALSSLTTLVRISKSSGEMVRAPTLQNS